MSTYTTLLPNIIRSKVYMGDKVKIGFYDLKGKKNLNIVVGHIIATRLGLKKGDRVSVGINDMNPNIWLIKKDPIGWTLTESGKTKNQPLLKIQMTNFKLDLPEGFRLGQSLFINHDLFEGGLRLFLPGASPEDKII